MRSSLQSLMILAFLLLFNFVDLCAAEADDGSTMNIRMDLYSRYFYRGFDYNLGKPAFQPNFYYSHSSGFEFNLFTTFGLDKKTEFDEFDISGKYKFELDNEFSLFAGLTGNFFMNTESMPTRTGKFDYSYEAQMAINYSSGDISTTILYAHDFKNADGDCVDINSAYSIQLSERTSFIPVLGAVYQTEYGISGSFMDKFTAVYLYLPFEINFQKVTLIPSYNISYIPSEKMRAINESCNTGYKKFLQFAGFSVKYNF